jgi:Flp pilus assembly protein TadG
MGRTKEFGRVHARRQKSPNRCEGDAGTSLVEMAFLLVPLCLFLFGIIVYGYLMSFRQNMTQAAAEGARAGAVAPVDAGYVTAKARALDATNKALSSFTQSCGTGGVTCTFTVTTSSSISNPCSTAPACINVTVSYDYATYPLMPNIPIVSNAIPSTFVSSSSAQLNP